MTTAESNKQVKELKGKPLSELEYVVGQQAHAPIAFEGESSSPWMDTSSPLRGFSRYYIKYLRKPTLN